MYLSIGTRFIVGKHDTECLFQHTHSREKRHWIEPRAHSTKRKLQPSAQASEGYAPDASSQSIEIQAASASGSASSHSNGQSRRSSTEDVLVTILHDLSGIAPERLRKSATFLELGFDSLFLTQVARAIHSECGVPITFRQLVEELNSITVLSSYIASKLPPIPPESARQQSDNSVNTLSDLVPAQASAFDRIDKQLRNLSGEIERLAASIESSRGTASAATTEPPRDSANDEQSVLLPLTDGQREIWLASQLSEDASRTYNLSYAVQIEGRLKCCMSEGMRPAFGESA